MSWIDAHLYGGENHFLGRGWGMIENGERGPATSTHLPLFLKYRYNGFNCLKLLTLWFLYHSGPNPWTVNRSKLFFPSVSFAITAAGEETNASSQGVVNYSHKWSCFSEAHRNLVAHKIVHSRRISLGTNLEAKQNNFFPPCFYFWVEV